MKVFTQLIKEFWLPCLAAFVWTAANFYSRKDDTWTIVSFINIFGPSFFLASWITGQYFRVTKQNKVQSTLAAIEQRSQELLDNLQIRTSVLLDQISGGDSFCYLDIATLDTGINRAIISHKGVYPLFDLTVEIVDLDLFFSTNKKQASQTVTIETLLPNHTRYVNRDFLGDAESRSFNIFWSARNGFFTQLLRCKKINGTWLRAIKLERNGIVLLESISDDYPLNHENAVDW